MSSEQEKPISQSKAGYAALDEILRIYGRDGRFEKQAPVGDGQLALSKNQEAIHLRFFHPRLKFSEYWVVGPTRPKQVTCERPVKLLFSDLETKPTKGIIRRRDLKTPAEQEAFDKNFSLTVARIQQMFEIHPPTY